ncbi:MAG: hypothetical protein ABIZ50_05190 [Solirubrobacterales bacterium]
MSAGAQGPDDTALDRILAEQIYTGESYKPFGEMTLAEVKARAEELRGAAGFGPTQKVASVAAVWKGLAEAMERESAATVAELDRETLRSRADRLWVVPPGGSFL